MIGKHKRSRNLFHVPSLPLCNSKNQFIIPNNLTRIYLRIFCFYKVCHLLPSDAFWKVCNVIGAGRCLWGGHLTAKAAGQQQALTGDQRMSKDHSGHLQSQGVNPKMWVQAYFSHKPPKSLDGWKTFCLLSSQTSFLEPKVKNKTKIRQNKFLFLYVQGKWFFTPLKKTSEECQICSSWESRPGKVNLL